MHLCRERASEVAHPVQWLEHRFVTLGPVGVRGPEGPPADEFSGHGWVVLGAQAAERLVCAPVGGAERDHLATSPGKSCRRNPILYRPGGLRRASEQRHHEGEVFVDLVIDLEVPAPKGGDILQVEREKVGEEDEAGDHAGDRRWTASVTTSPAASTNSTTTAAA